MLDVYISVSAGLMTSRVCDLSIVIMIMTYLWCAVGKAAVIFGLTSVSWLQKSRTGWTLCSSYVVWLCLRLVMNSPFAEVDL